jgi:hypothetical protein
MSVKAKAALLTLSRKAEREFERSLNAGLSEDAALACAKYVERARKASGARRVFVPRWRAPGAGRL